MEQFAALWEVGDGPADVFEFLARHPDASGREKLAIVCADQARRWQTDRPLLVEDYRAQLPEVESDVDAKLALIVGGVPRPSRRPNGDVVDIVCLLSDACTKRNPTRAMQELPERSDIFFREAVGSGFRFVVTGTTTAFWERPRGFPKCKNCGSPVP